MKKIFDEYANRLITDTRVAVYSSGFIQVADLGEFAHKDGLAMFDIASLTKLVVHLRLLAYLDEKKLKTQSTLSELSRTFLDTQFEHVRLQDLLTFVDKADEDIWKKFLKYDKDLTLEEFKSAVLSLSLNQKRGFKYNNCSTIIVSWLLCELLSIGGVKVSLADIFEQIAKEAGVENSFYFHPYKKGDEKVLSRCIPTTPDLQPGQVHDPLARKRDGDYYNLGHAGLFADALSLTKVITNLLSKINITTLKKMTQNQLGTLNNNAHKYGLGVDIPFENYFENKSIPTRNCFLFTGFTGGIVWVDLNDLGNPIIVVLLCNATYFGEESEKRKLLSSFRRKMLENVLSNFY